MYEQIQRFDPRLALGWENLLDDVSNAHERINTLEEHSDEQQHEFESRVQYLQRQIEELQKAAKC